MEYQIKEICQKPVIYIVEDFLTAHECDYLIEKGKERLKPSTVINLETGEGNTDSYRTSKTMFFNRQEDLVIGNIEQRISHLTGFPIEKGENIQLVNYNLGEYYKGHHDYFDPVSYGNRVHLERGGQRLMTVLVYLNDVELGGDTSFPELGIKAIPKKGRALCWWNCMLDGTIDPNTKHASDPVLKGEKWIMTKWLHETEYN